MINAQSNWQQSHAHAFKLLEALVQDAHEIVGVFFYGRSVHMVTDAAISKQWLDWANNNQAAMIVCSTMLNQDQLTTEATDKGFQVAGMAAWVDWCQQAERVVELT